MENLNKRQRKEKNNLNRVRVIGNLSTKTFKSKKDYNRNKLKEEIRKEGW